MRRKGGGNKGHGLDRVLGRRVIDINIDFFATLDFKSGRTDTTDFYTKFFKVKTDILNHVVWRGTDDGSFTWIKGGGHQDIFSHGIATLGENDFSIWTTGWLFNGNFIKTTVFLGVDIEAEGVKSFKMGLDGARTKRTAAGIGKAELFIAMQERAHKHNN